MRLTLPPALAVALALLVFAPAASAAGTRYGELSLAAPGTPGTHVLPVQRAPFAFDLLGARWRAEAGASVEVRTQAGSASWSAWTRLEADAGGAVSHADPVWLPGSRLLQL
ncbi:MAG: hypothetical protein M3Q31_27590, partial [Actinomycetota bacterium]|nr:hypothetical protein [Actinomycetota bacterium]